MKPPQNLGLAGFENVRRGVYTGLVEIDGANVPRGGVTSWPVIKVTSHTSRSLSLLSYTSTCTKLRHLISRPSILPRTFLWLWRLGAR